MPKKETKKVDSIQKKLEYLCLDLNNIPKKLIKFDPLEVKINKFNDEKQYRQYRYIPVEDIQILLSPTNRLDEIEEKYKKARPLAEYLDSESEENFLRYTKFLNMLRQFKIADVEKIEKEQNLLNKKIPFKVKFEGNYLWQIYYSEIADKYFMIVPTEDTDYSAFFFLIKQKLYKFGISKIFVPIKNVNYSTKYLKKSEYEDIENYLWLFTKNWPLVYEVYDKDENLSIRIVGETEVYGKIKSQYRIKLENKEEATKFYKLLKAMYILQTKLPNYFDFRTDINKKGSIDFVYNDKIILYENIAGWIREEYKIAIEKMAEAKNLVDLNDEKLKKLKEEVSLLEIEYLAKEKQISTFLECKKTFFGKFKYYFKYSKKNSSAKMKKQKNNIDVNSSIDFEKMEYNGEKHKNDELKSTKSNYKIENLLDIYKEYEKVENALKNLVMDINALKLKKKNMKKKIENATNFIKEIDSHKKSIFEFWRYSNKDEMEALPEGEEEEVNIIKKITKVFDYEEDIEKFGKTMDQKQRKLLSDYEKDSIYITSTNLIEIVNKVKNNEISPKEIELNLKGLIKESLKESTISGEEYNIFGGMEQDETKISKINNQKHRETHKDIFNVLDINKATKPIGYKITLENIIKNVKSALSKVKIEEDIQVYKALNAEKLSKKNINVFEINPEVEIKNALKNDNGKINFYKINLKKGANAISFTNCIFYDNHNRTLPIGQDLSTNILVDISKLKLKLKKKLTFKILNYEDDKNDFSKISLKTINVLEYECEE